MSQNPLDKDYRHTAVVGNYVEPDNWPIGELLKEDDGFSDSGFPGCQFRLPCQDMELAVNIKVTGKAHWCYKGFGAKWRSRCKIEFVGDCEPSTFSGGWIYYG